MTNQWADYDRDSIQRRYDRLAPYIKLFEWLFWMPTGFRRRAVQTLALRQGDRVLEIGCGTGRNLGFLSDAVGPGGRVYGVDLSEGMLAKAHELGQRKGWHNVTLACQDALSYVAPEPLDGVLFGLSYNTMPHHHEVLKHALTQLKPGGRIVIMDSKLPSGRFGRAILPFSLWLMRRTFLGNPFIRPWEHLAQVTHNFEMRTFMFDAHYICRGTKPAQISASRSSAA